jgi:hypothetical protein
MTEESIDTMKKIILDQLMVFRRQGYKRIEIIKAARRAATDFESREEYL